MAVMFNVLRRGSWRGASPLVTKQYTYRTDTPADTASPGPLQVWKRQSSINPSAYYSYHRALPYEGKIQFGLNGVMQYDFYNYAQMPFNHPETVAYNGRRGVRQVLAIHPASDREDKPFSPFASKYSPNYGIFYAHYDGTHDKIADYQWYGLSVADKDAIPTLMQASIASSVDRAAKIMTNPFGFTSSSEARDVYVYPNRIVDGSTVYYFDDNDHNARVRYVYMVLQSNGGTGGNSTYSYGVVIFPICTNWVSGSGGGAGAWCLDLVRIPEDGYLKVRIPQVLVRVSQDVTKTSHRADPVTVTHHDGTVMRQVIAAEWGKTPPTRNTWNGRELSNGPRISGGSGGYVSRNSVDSKDYPLEGTKHIRHIVDVDGSQGASNEYNSEIDKNYEKNVSGSSKTLMIPPTVLDTDGYVNIPGIAGVPAWWDSDDIGNIPGGGASSLFARGGDFAPLSNGQAGTGPGAGGGGGAKAIFNWYYGGPGGNAYVCIGY